MNENAEIIEPEISNLANKPLIKYGWLRALLFLVAAFIVLAIGSSLGILFVATISDLNMDELVQDVSRIVKDLGVFYYMIPEVLVLLGTLFIAWVFRKFIDKKSFLSLGFEIKKYTKDFLIGFGWGFILISSGFVILYISGSLIVTEISFSPYELIGYFLLFVFGAIYEEIMIRGYILNNLMESMNKYFALIVSSLLFSILHVGNPNMSFIAFLNILLAGILLGIYYVHKQNLWFPIALHMSWNFFQGPIWGFEVSGMKSETFIIQEMEGSILLTGGEFGFEGSLLATILMIISIIFIHYQYKEKRHPAINN